MDSLSPQLALLHLTDSALPIGTAAHSFGLETLVAEGALAVGDLAGFLADYIAEIGGVEGGCCRAAHALGAEAGPGWEDAWQALNDRFGAMKPARESRAASAVLGRRLLAIVAQLLPSPVLAAAQGDAHHAAAFGLIGGALGVEADLTVAAYLQQLVAGLVSACQRLLPLGQSQAQHLIWTSRPAVVAAATASAGRDWTAAACCVPAVELASLRHPLLATRLFIS
jgi:urease accessory protein